MYHTVGRDALANYIFGPIRMYLAYVLLCSIQVQSADSHKHFNTPTFKTEMVHFVSNVQLVKHLLWKMCYLW